MTTQLRCHLPPADAQIVNTSLAIYRDGDRIVYFAHGGPIFAHQAEDQAGARIALAEATSLGLAKPKELAEAVGVHRSTIHRNVQRLEEGGVVAVIGERPGPEGPHKLTPDRLEEAQRWLDEGLSISEVGRRLGVSDAAIHHALNRGLLRRKIRELVQRGLSYAFGPQLAQRWVEQNEEVLGFLYVDGHVRPYHGHRHQLPKTWVPRRRLCMPAETDFWVNDQRGDPILSITARANQALAQLCQQLNECEIVYPGAWRRMHYELAAGA